MYRSSRSLLSKSISMNASSLSRNPTHPSFAEIPPTRIPSTPIPLPSLKPTNPNLPISQSPHILGTQLVKLSLEHYHHRGFSSSEHSIDYGREVDEINLKFAEAREEIDAAMESKETVYFDEEAECAREAVKEVLCLFDGLLARLSEKDRSALQRSMGLKMEQLKAELKQLDE